MSSAGLALPLTVWFLFLMSVIGVTTGFIRYQMALSARQQGLANLGDAQIAALRPEVDVRMLALTEAVRSRARARLRSTSPFLDQAGLSGLAQDAQTEADALFCQTQQTGRIAHRIRVHFTGQACGQGLPTGVSLPAPRAAEETALMGAYDLPFVLVLESEITGEMRRVRTLSGRIRVVAGSPAPSYFQVYALSGYDPSGTPSPFRGYQVWDGPVYVAGVPTFGRTYSGDQGGPVFLGGLMTGRCLGISGSACPGGQGDPAFVDVGAVRPEAMYPSPFAPCYGPSCLKVTGGVDWNAPVQDLPSLQPPSLAVNGPGRVFMKADSLAGQRITLINLTREQDTIRYVLTESTTRYTGSWQAVDRGLGIWAGANANILAPSLDDTLGWSSSCNNVRVVNGVLETRCRDAYYGYPSPVSGSTTWRIAFEADATQARGPVQVGFQARNANGQYCWWGTGNLAGQRVPAGTGWTRVEATITLPATCGGAAVTHIRPWVQIDDNPPHSGAGVAYLRNLSAVKTGGSGEYVLFMQGTPHLLVKGSLEVQGPADQAAYMTSPGLTLAADGDVTVKGNLFSSDPPCLNPAGFDTTGSPIPGECPGQGGAGILLLASLTGDVVVDVPSDTKVHGYLYAPQGTVRFGPNQAGDLFLQGGMAVRYLGDTGTRRIRVAYDPGLRSMVPWGLTRLPLDAWGVMPLYSWQDLR